MTPELKDKLNRHGCSSAIEYIEQLERDNARLTGIKAEWQEVVQPVFDYVDAAGFGTFGESKITALIQSHKELSAHAAAVRSAWQEAYNCAIACEMDEESGHFVGDDWFGPLEDAVNNTPQQSVEHLVEKVTRDVMAYAHERYASAYISQEKPNAREILNGCLEHVKDGE